MKKQTGSKLIEYESVIANKKTLSTLGLKVLLKIVELSEIMRNCKMFS